MTQTTPQQYALVTGANRGLGLGVVEALARKGFGVVLGSRDAAKGAEAAHRLKEQGLSVEALHLDVTADKSVRAAFDFVKEKWGRLDVLVNNAGVFLDGIVGQPSTGALTTPVSTLEQTLETNLVGAYRMCQTFLPLIQKSPSGRIVNVSSGMGGLTEMQGGSPAYRISKTALNSLTKVLSLDLKDSRILVNSVCPGWVRTDMGGASATRDLDQGVASILWAATLPDNGPSGGYYRDGKSLPW